AAVVGRVQVRELGADHEGFRDAGGEIGLQVERPRARHGDVAPPDDDPRQRAAPLEEPLLPLGRRDRVELLLRHDAPGRRVFALSSSGLPGPAASAATPDAYRLVTTGAGPTPSPTGAVALRQVAGASKSHGHAWFVGFDKESVDPTAADLAAGVHLGGFGLG